MQVIVYTRGPLLFAFNFHTSDSYEIYKVGVQEAGEYQVRLHPSPGPICARSVIVSRKLCWSSSMDCHEVVVWLLQLVLNTDELKFGGLGRLHSPGSSLKTTPRS